MKVTITTWSDDNQLIESQTFYEVRSVSFSHNCNPHLLIFFDKEDRNMEIMDIDTSKQSFDIH